MKKRIVRFTFIGFFIFFVNANAQTFKWAAQLGGNDYETGEDIAFDSLGNVYLVGIFNSTGDFNPDINNFNLSSAGAQDVYILKLDSNRNFNWAVRIGGSHQDFSYSIGVKGSSVYVCGNFKDTADFNPGAGMNNLIAAGGSDIFILKLDTASNFTWVKQIGGTGNDVAEKMTIDQAGNLLICGQFQNTVDFNPGAGVQNMTSIGSADAYVLKLAANGNYVWAGQYGNNPGQFALGVATDASNDVYVTGEFYGTTDFDPGTGVYNLIASGFNANIYVLKWSSSGNFIWADNMGNSSGGDAGVAIKTDVTGNPVITGFYFGTVDFDPGAGIFNLTATGTNGDIFILKLASSTGAFLFAKSIGGAGLDQSYGLALNAAGNIYLTGFFSLTADFDPDTSTYYLTATGPGDVFILELDAVGNFLWAYGFGGSDNDFGRGISSFGSDIYICGVFAYSPDFDPGLQVYNLNSFANSSDAFLMKLRFCTPAQTTLNYNLCPGDSVFAGGDFQNNPGVYYDYFMATDGCDSIVTSIVQYTFILNPGNDVNSCSGQTVVLNANVPGASYLWSTGATTSSIPVTISNNYWVSINYNGCVQYDTVLVTFNPLPLVDLGNDTAICISSALTLNAGAGFVSYLWSDGSTGETFNFNGSAGTGIYTVGVAVTDSSGCVNNDTLVITVNLCAGIDFVNSPSTFNVYPVPADDFMDIETIENIKQITLFNIAGKEMLQLNYEQGINFVKLSFRKFSAGMYFLQVKGDQFLRIKKVVIKH